MKTFYYTIICSFFSVVGFAQVSANGEVGATASETSVFLNASGPTFQSSNGFSADGSGNLGKGIAFPRTNLTSFVFAEYASGDFPANFDGMVVYNIGVGVTPTSGSGIGGEAIVPGFYFFSNPGSQFDTNSGNWIPVGNSAIATKKREVIKTIEVGATTATVDLTSGDNSGQGMAGVTVNQFIGAKIYNNATGQLQMDASSSYVDGTAKILTTGNGFISQVLPAGTYKFVIEYK